jgi:CRISPR-associated endonuclease/helicase Cas3
MDYEELFRTLTDQAAFPYQARLAEGPWPHLLDVPTGLGKTLAVVGAWLWRRLNADPGTPRRLVYVLPTRVLVEQTWEVTRACLARAAPHFRERGREPPALHRLLGGEVEEGWGLCPARDAILVGTQDQLLSRALNRGYSLSRARWPWDFALLSNDALWALDETQLMGPALPTSAQLQGLRDRIGSYGPTHTLWMSATLDQRALATVDAPRPLVRLGLGAEDLDHEEVRTRRQAAKAVSRHHPPTGKGADKALARHIAEAHRPGTLTLVVRNRVPWAQATFRALVQEASRDATAPELLLVHGRFRPGERKHLAARLAAPLPAPGRIVVATQTVEAGVDLDARLLVTDLAPWPSLVQRFGRCNRRGAGDDARILWLDVDDKAAAPYATEALAFARETLAELPGAAPAQLEAIRDPAGPPVHPVLRRKDLYELFDTSADLSGADVDVSRFVREAGDTDVHGYWRDWEGAGDGEPPPHDLPASRGEELCPIPVGELREHLKGRHAWRWDFTASGWRPVSPQTGGATELWPGLTVLLPAAAGGYAPDLGWCGRKAARTEPLPHPGQGTAGDAADSDTGTFQPGRWVTLAEHGAHVAAQAEGLRALLAEYADLPWPEVVTAARWHDLGKAHEAFQNMLEKAGEPPPDGTGPWAKSGGRRGGRPYYFVRLAGTEDERQPRPAFRHELASALALLAQGESDLTAYLAACHHGKVRLALRALPREDQSAGRIARGVRDADRLPPVHLADGHQRPQAVLDLAYMDLGRQPVTGESWTGRALALLDRFGPFRLAYLETLVRIADWRATIAEEQQS